MNAFIAKLVKLPSTRLFPAATEKDILAFEKSNSVIISNGYKEWLNVSDGGEIFSPAGVQLYGVKSQPLIEKGDDASAPKQLTIIGRTSFGDPICFSSGSEKIIQWDHESNEEFLSWDSFVEFLKDAQETYGEES